MNFVAVILGVYLAFYVNERAKISEEKKEGILLMQSMINDLSSDIKTCKKYQIPVNTNYQKAIDSLLLLLSTNQIDEINNQLLKIFQVENYVPNTSTYNSIKSAGKMNLIADLDLQKRLSDYYDGLAIECTKKNEIQVEFFMNELVSWLTLNADLVEMKLLNGNELMVLKNKLLIYESLVAQKINNYEMIVNESELLKKQLESLVQEK